MRPEKGVSHITYNGKKPHPGRINQSIGSGFWCRSGDVRFKCRESEVAMAFGHRNTHSQGYAVARAETYMCVIDMARRRALRRRR